MGINKKIANFALRKIDTELRKKFIPKPDIYETLAIMNTKKILSLASLTLAALLFAGASLSFAGPKASAPKSAKAAKITVTNATDARITYIGRTLTEGDKVSFDWSGVQCRVRFSGRGISLRCSDTKANYYNVWLDRGMETEPDKVIRTAGSDTLIVLFEGLKRGEHSLILQKRTEGEQGRTTFSAFEIEGGEILSPEPLRERYIEFVGDSYTCGYGAENSVKSDPFTPETENCNKTYAALVSRYFGADFTLVSHSGMGVVRNYNDHFRGVPGKTMPERYGSTFDEEIVPLAAPERIPDLVVIYLGTNDFSVSRQPSLAEFCDGYSSLVGKIRSRYGAEVPILCMSSRCDPLLYDYMVEACSRIGDPRVHTLGLQKDVHNDEGDLGASWHPNYLGHRKIASVVIPYIATIMDWEMKD